MSFSMRFMEGTGRESYETKKRTVDKTGTECPDILIYIYI